MASRFGRRVAADFDPRTQLHERVHPEIEMIHRQVRLDVPDLLLARGPHFFDFMKVLLNRHAIGERFYEQKSAEWREDQKDILRRLEEHQDASQSHVDVGIALMELANRAADLFAEQPATEKRRLLIYRPPVQALRPWLLSLVYGHSL